MDESINMVNELHARKRAEAAQRAEDKATVSANRAKRRARFRRCAGEVASCATLGGLSSSLMRGMMILRWKNDLFGQCFYN